MFGNGLILIAVFAAAYAGTLCLRRYALARQILDVPNERSSHVRPTPRGGGVAIVMSFLAGIGMLYAKGDVDSGLLGILAGGGGLIALIGFWDDHASLPARVRIVFHAAAAVWALFILGGWPTLDLGFGSVAWGIAGAVVGVVGLVWLLNLYNFMDGIDGIAGTEAVFVASAGALMLGLEGVSPFPLLMLAAASLGFLLLNWPPARIFMGDAGSGFIGYALGGFALHAVVTGVTAVWPWLILLGVFCVDATVTLVRRWLRGQKWYAAHRSHAYQWASRRYAGHRPVTLAVLLIDIVWLFPCALLAQSYPQWAIPTVLVAYLPLVLLALHFNAGEAEEAGKRS